MPRTRKIGERQPEAVRLKRLRETLQISQRELAKNFKVAPAAIAQWELGTSTVPGSVLRLIEIYEEELGFEQAAPSIETGWAKRTLASSATGALWLLAHRLFGGEARGGWRDDIRAAALRRYAKELNGLKGLGMKLAQMVGYMDFSLSASERQMLAELQTQTRPMTAALVAQVFIEEFGRPPRLAFADWSREPLAAASIGQVHRATLHSGQQVVFKLQYPRVVAALKADLRNVRVLDHCVSLIFRQQAPHVIFDEWRKHFLQECDYRQEAQMQRAFGRFFSGRKNIKVPKVIDAFSGEKIITSSYLAGRSFEEFSKTAPQATRDRAAMTIWNFHYEAILRHGVFHTDPHPGNFVFDEASVGFLDFGRVQKLSAAFVAALRAMIRAVLERDREALRRVLVALDVARGDFDFDVGYRAVQCFFCCALSDTPFSFTPQYLARVWDAFMGKNKNRHAVNYPREMVFFNQLFFGVNAVLARLDARIACRDAMLCLVYEKGETRPKPYTRSELADAGVA